MCVVKPPYTMRGLLPTVSKHSLNGRRWCLTLNLQKEKQTIFESREPNYSTSGWRATVFSCPGTSTAELVCRSVRPHTTTRHYVRQRGSETSASPARALVLEYELDQCCTRSIDTRLLHPSAYTCTSTRGLQW